MGLPGTPESLSTGDASPDHVLIVDDDPCFRDVVLAQLHQAGYTAHAAANYEDGLKLASDDEQIRLVILDHPSVGSRVDGIVGALRRARPNAMIVGNSGSDRRGEFAMAGVVDYLQKPWRLADLMSLLRRPLDACVCCGRPLPLRRPGLGEIGSSWVCVSCGARYRAVLDEAAPADLQRYVASATAPPS